MSLTQALREIGYSAQETQFLLQHEWFHHKTKTTQELLAVFQRIADVYDCDQDTVKGAVLKFPQFAGYDHERAVREAAEVYGDAEAVKKAVLKYPPFAGYDHERVVRDAAEVYGDAEAVKKAVLKFPPFANLDHDRVVREAVEVYGDAEAVKKAVLKYPPFAGYDHERVVRDAVEVYGDAEAVKKAVLKFPPFVGLDHERVVREAVEVYGDAEAVKKAVLKFPPFAGLDHARVVRERVRLGRMVRLTRQEVISKILETPVLAGYSAKRYIAGLDVRKALEKEGFRPDKEMLAAYFCYIGKSPYVPRSKRKRISQLPGSAKEPPLLKAMRKRLRGRRGT
jgi:hypothetical protein